MTSVSAPAVFIEALTSLRQATVRADLLLEEIPAPDRLAPFTAALRVQTRAEELGAPLGTGRLVILHDPAGSDSWAGDFRLVGHVRTQMDPELAADALLGEVVWAWLHQSLDVTNAAHHHLMGTVTREISESFGGLQLHGSTVAVEIRASWTPTHHDLGPHLLAWAELVAVCAGLLPRAELGVGSR